MSDSGESYTLSDTGESRTTSEAGDSSAFSDWSMVDSHGEMRDDETASTGSSVEVVDDADDDSNIEPVTPVAGSPSVVAPCFILRLPSHNQDESDTDEDKQEHVTDSSVSEHLNTVTPAHVKAGQSFRQSSPETRVSREQIEEFRQTIDHLKKNLLPSQQEDSSVSSLDLFGDGKSDGNNLKTDSHLPTARTVENTDIHGNLTDGSLSLESSVSSSYSFLSRDTGTECFLLEGSADGLTDTGKHPDVGRGVTPECEVMQGTSGQACTNETQTVQETVSTETHQDQTEADTAQETHSQETQSATGHGLKKYLSQFLVYPVKYIFLAGLVAYTGVVIVAVYSIHTQGQDVLKEPGVIYQCNTEREVLQIKLDTCDKDILDRTEQMESTAQKLAMLRKENSVISLQLENKEKEVEKLHDEINILTEENKRLTKTDSDLLVKQREMLGEIDTLHSQVEQSASDCSGTKQSLQKCMKEIEELRLQKMDTENMKYNSDMEFSSAQKQCQTDINNLRSQYQFEIDSIRKQYQSDLDLVRNQYQSDLDKIRSEYQSNVDSLTMHLKANNKYMQSQNSDDKKCNGKGNQYEDIVGDETLFGDDAHTTNSQSKQHRRDQKHSRRSSGSNAHNYNEKEDNSDEYSNEGRNSGSYWAEKVLDIMNKTREQIQDTWSKVKDMSESLWQEHQPSLYRLHDSFTKKFQHLSKRFQNKLAKKMRKWIHKGKKYTQQWYNGQEANTKRRPFKSEDDVSSSNHTVEDRLVKLSHQVQALNARKFRKWKDSPKVLVIQEEVNQVNFLVNKGDDDGTEKNKLTDQYLKWLSCQFQWWKNLHVLMVSDDCYLSLCCWQVKVTGGDAKQCRRIKRKLGIVEDTCILEHSDQSKTSKGENQNSKYGPVNSDRKHVAKDEGASSVPHGHEGSVDKEPGSGLEDNWFLARGEDREYYREVPDDWFFRRQNQENEQVRKKHVTDEIYEGHDDGDDNDIDDNEDDDYDDDDDDYCDSRECNYDFLSGHCGCP